MELTRGDEAAGQGQRSDKDREPRRDEREACLKGIRGNQGQDTGEHGRAAA